MEPYKARIEMQGVSSPSSGANAVSEPVFETQAAPASDSQAFGSDDLLATQDWERMHGDSSEGSGLARINAARPLYGRAAPPAPAYSVVGTASMNHSMASNSGMPSIATSTEPLLARERDASFRGASHRHTADATCGRAAPKGTAGPAARRSSHPAAPAARRVGRSASRPKLSDTGASRTAFASAAAKQKVTTPFVLPDGGNPHRHGVAPPTRTQGAAPPLHASSGAAGVLNGSDGPHARTGGRGMPTIGAPKLPVLSASRPAKGGQLVKPTFVPAQKLDPRQLKEAVRRWYRFDLHGKMSIIQADKYELTHSLGVHSRDLRILDANVNSSYPACILCREQALVINLEYIQVIVTTDTTLVLNAERANEVPPAKSFVEELQTRLRGESGSGNADAAASGLDDEAAAQNDTCSASGVAPATAPLAATGERRTFPMFKSASANKLEQLQQAAAAREEAAQLQAAIDMPGSASEAQSREISYELKVLEVCLDSVATFFSDAVRTLEQDSELALRDFTAKVTAANLERVRRVKSRMVRLSTRVETVRGVLEKYLGDDDDLAELHLTGQRLLAEQHREKLQQREQRRLERQQRYTAKRERKLLDDPEASEPSSISNSTFTLSDEDTGWLSSYAEMVIEPYFMSFDNTFNRLQAIGEFVEDSEDYVNLILDSHRNQLIQVDLLLTMASFCVGLVTLVAGIFGMNLRSGLEESAGTFDAVSIVSCLLAVLLLVLFVILMRRWQLAFV